MSVSKRHILHVLVRLDYGGIETWLLNILRNYNRQKFQMDVCLIGRRGDRGLLACDAENAGSSLFIIPLRNPIHFVQKFRKLCANYEAVIVHTEIHISSLVLYAANLGGVRHRLIMLHNTFFAVPFNGLDKLKAGSLLNLNNIFFNKINKVLSTEILGCSMAALDQNYPDWRSHHYARVLNYGINTDKFLAEVNYHQLKESLGIPEEACVVGHVGRFSRQKNHLHFIDVARHLSKIDPTIHFLLVGDGPLRAEIETQIRNNELQDRFHLTGIRNDIPGLMKVMDIAYFPSLHEGFPLTFIEAQVSGLVVVTMARAELCEAICPQNHKWCIVDTDRIINSVEAIYCLLNNPSLREHLKINAQQWALERFSIKQSTVSLEKILERKFEGIQLG